MPRWPERKEGMEKPKRARKRKLETDQGEPEAIISRYSGGQGVHREVESEGHAEKYRAVVDGGCPEDEPVGQRWGKVEPALWRRRRSHSPTAPRCLRTARYGRTTRDLRRTDRVPGWHRSKWTYKWKRSGERSPVSSRTTEQYLKHGESYVTEQSAAEVGRGRQSTKRVGKKEETR
jgi:hypothetical protein